ncbi:M48 family metalloprotease [Rugamonas sp. CCM 8940]|uniref:M48 family metalloprotease n=1 Tax=Rugamonas sp. CCM 8940 TaxID=2765359 RepID=UPI0018F2DA2F|nr:M48 family metalloprotease [Rugamonas sp. CCM 8940]MBJ7309730.1 M48 family metalloprotease [Rugamonas sp. CCM 8940]
MWQPMRALCLLMLGLLTSASAGAQVAAGVNAEAVTQQLVAGRAAELYAERLAALRAAHALDVHGAVLERVRRIAGGLIAQARRDYPDSADWAWELHVTTDEEHLADGMAGGKMLLGEAYLERLEIADAELAMLLAHEMAHALLRHNLLEYQLALRLDRGWARRPFLALEEAVESDSALIAKLAPQGLAQEAEADREGLLLAWRAGWPAARLANYFKKLARGSGLPNFDSATHPSPASRWAAARALAATLPAGAAWPDGDGRLFP